MLSLNKPAVTMAQLATLRPMALVNSAPSLAPTSPPLAPIRVPTLPLPLHNRVSFGQVPSLLQGIASILKQRKASGLPFILTGFDMDGTLRKEGNSALELVKTLARDNVPVHVITNNSHKNVAAYIKAGELPMPDVLSSHGGTLRHVQQQGWLQPDAGFADFLEATLNYSRSSMEQEIEDHRATLFPPNEVLAHEFFHNEESTPDLCAVMALRGNEKDSHDRHQAILTSLVERLKGIYPETYGDIVTMRFHESDYTTRNGQQMNPNGDRTLYCYLLTPFNKGKALHQLGEDLAPVTGKHSVISFAAGDTAGDVHLLDEPTGVQHPGMFVAVGNAQQELKTYLNTYPMVNLPDVKLQGGELRQLTQNPPRYAYQAPKDKEGPNGIMAGYEVLKQILHLLVPPQPTPTPQPPASVSLTHGKP